MQKNKFNSLKKWIKRDGFIFANAKLAPIGKRDFLNEISETDHRFDAPVLHRHIEKINNLLEH